MAQISPPQTSASDQAIAFWVTAPGQGELRGERLPPPGPDDVLVQTLYSGISRGTETLVFSGRVPASEAQRMRAPFQAGEFPAPVKYGYISVGVVVEGPPALCGKSVFCLYPHQTRYRVPAAAVYPLPERVPPERAVLAANLETAINGLWDADLRIGDRLTVIGAGTLGCLVAWLAARVPGCEVELVDTNPARGAIAAALGVAFATPATAAGERDRVIHASGSPAGLTTALALAGFETTLVELSWFGSQPVSLPLGEGFHANRLTLRASQVGQVATSQRARWTHGRRLALALRLLEDPRLDGLISGESPFADLPRVMARLAAPDARDLCHRIRYP